MIGRRPNLRSCPRKNYKYSIASPGTEISIVVWTRNHMGYACWLSRLFAALWKRNFAVTMDSIMTYLRS